VVGLPNSVWEPNPEFSPGLTIEKTRMYETLTRQEFLQSLRQSGLLSGDEVERVDAANPDADSSALASTLVASSLLTAYQM
jgi:hypothetical protein